MEPIEYEIMFHREEDYWWHVGLRDLVLRQIARLARRRKSLTMLDAGCGTGKLLATCQRHKPYGLEYSPVALSFLRRRGLVRVVRASVCQIPFPDESFDVIASMDVLYTVSSPGDVQGLREMTRVLRPGGWLLLNLPAYEWLRSHHDLAVHTQRRYRQTQLRTLLAEVGLQVVTMSYRNTALFPIALVVRTYQKLVQPNPEKAESDLKPLPRFLNRVLTLPLLLENRLIQLGWRLPFGLSLYCVAVKP